MKFLLSVTDYMYRYRKIYQPVFAVMQLEVA